MVGEVGICIQWASNDDDDDDGDDDESGGGVQKINGEKSILRAFSVANGGRQICALLGGGVQKSWGRKMHFASGRRAQGAFYPRP